MVIDYDRIMTNYRELKDKIYRLNRRYSFTMSSYALRRMEQKADRLGRIATRMRAWISRAEEIKTTEERNSNGKKKRASRRS